MSEISTPTHERFYVLAPTVQIAFESHGFNRGSKSIGCDTSELEAEVKDVQEQWRRVKCLINS